MIGLLNENTGYLLGFLLSVSAFVYFNMRIKEKSAGQKVRMNIILTVFLFISVYLFAKSFFPMPFMASVIGSEFQKVANYFIPFERLFTDYHRLVVVGDIAVTDFIVKNIVFAAVSILKSLSVGFLISALLQMSIKKIAILSAVLAVAVEAMQYLSGAIIGINYLHVSSEEAIYFFLGCMMGFGIYRLILHFTQQHAKESRIVRGINDLLLAGN